MTESARACLLMLAWVAALLGSDARTSSRPGRTTGEPSNSASSASGGALQRDQSSRQGFPLLVPVRGGPPQPFPTIQAAVDAAASGDTVLLPSGVYSGEGNRNVTVMGKDVRIVGEGGAQQCTIDIGAGARAFWFEGSAVSPATLLRGITLRAGGGPHMSGGAVICFDGAQPTIEECVFTECQASSGGGLAYFGPGLVRDCLFVSNSASGGGAYWGGAIVERCTFVGNQADDDGGAIRTVSATVRDCLIVGNSGGSGGGVFLAGAAELINCTVVGNTANRAGGIVFTSGDTVRNCILWGNSAILEGQQAYQGCVFTCPNGVLDHCAIEGGAAGVDGFGTVPQLIAPVTLDPEFVDAMAGDYRLSPTSPCIDTGDRAFMPDLHEGDLENQPRVNGGAVDIGADEHWSGLTLGFVSPGRAGEVNAIEATQARAGDLVILFAGTTEGGFPLPFGACPDLTLEIEDAAFLAALEADDFGSATYVQYVPPCMGGQLSLLQAVGFDPSTPQAGCEVSNLIPFLYP